MNREYYKWFSPALYKEMELLVFGHGGKPVLFFPTRSARFYDYENWHIVEALQDKIENGALQLFCVDSVDIESFYAAIPPADKIRRHIKYEEYILKEVMPLIQNKNEQQLIVAGCSLGGYHAANIAFRHPEYFSKVVSMSARYNLTLATSSFNDLLDGYIDENVYFNMPSMFLPNIEDEELLNEIRRVKIVVVIGAEDPFFENNRQLSDALQQKNIAHDFYVWAEEAHRPRYWKQMVKLYLE